MASREDISSEINSLAVHCRPPLMTADERAAWTVDWINDLVKFPIEAVRTGFRKWRHSGSTKFPTPGQILPLVRDAMPAEKSQAVTVWRDLSDDEYRALSVREKIRHHQILSHNAYSQAGPMFRNTSARGAPVSKASGLHLTPDDMDAAYRKWTDLGKHHAQEAHRLRQYVSGRPQALAAE